ncbi:MAG: P-II family nitrogen regulator [Tissierellia bacterium]|nr:P-II family nitrogen regulator [Tissierellia bacterium]
MSKQVNKAIYIAVVDDHMASKVMDEARKLGVQGATVFYGTYHQKNKFLNILGLECIRKEIMVCVIDKNIEDELHEILGQKFKINEKHCRFSYSKDLDYTYGLIEKNMKMKEGKMINQEINKEEYKAIYVIVDKNSGDHVINLAQQKGAKGATVIHGRGAGVKNQDSIFDLVIEPQKELVLFLVRNDDVEEIVNFLRSELEIDSPNKGIIFIMDVNRVYGLHS